MSAIKVEVSTTVFRTARECAFEAKLAARRAGDIAAEILEVSVELGSMGPDLPAALIAAQQARTAAQLAELAVIDGRVRQPYAEARKQYQIALRHEQDCALALRRYVAKVNDYARVRASVERKKQELRDNMRAPHPPANDASTSYSVIVDGEASPVGLRKDVHQFSVEKPHAAEPPN